MPSVLASGTYTLTAAEVTIGSTAANYVLVANIDLAALAAGDIVTLRMKAPVLSGGANSILWEETFSGVQAQPVKQSIPISAPFGAQLTAIQSAAPSSLKTAPWSLGAIA